MVLDQVCRIIAMQRLSRRPMPNVKPSYSPVSKPQIFSQTPSLLRTRSCTPYVTARTSMLGQDMLHAHFSCHPIPPPVLGHEVGRENWLPSKSFDTRLIAISFLSS